MNEVEILKCKVEKFETPMVNYTLGVINFDLSEFKKSIQEITDIINTQELNVNNVDEFYNLRAKLNNFNKKINDEKKKIKVEYNKPYLEFEAQVKECMKLIETASAHTDKQLKEYELMQKNILKEEYIKMWSNFGKDSKVPFERIENEKWYLKSTSKKKVLVEMTEINDKINNDLDKLYNVIQDKNEYDFVSENYFKSLDLAQELSNYTLWKNAIKQKEIVVEKVIEKEVKVNQEENKNAVETKFQALNQELTANNKVQNAIISFTADTCIIDRIELLLKENNVKYNIRRNEVYE